MADSWEGQQGRRALSPGPWGQAPASLPPTLPTLKETHPGLATPSPMRGALLLLPTEVHMALSERGAAGGASALKGGKRKGPSLQSSEGAWMPSGPMPGTGRRPGQRELPGKTARWEHSCWRPSLCPTRRETSSLTQKQILQAKGSRHSESQVHGSIRYKSLSISQAPAVPQGLG